MSLPLAQCQSIHVVARFAGRRCVALDNDWPILLDGLLAGVVHRRRPPRKADETADLPLGRFVKGVASQWSWLASVGLPLGHESPQWAYRWKAGPGPIAVECAGIEWRCVGDATSVRDLLAGVTELGNRRHSAEVAHWDVVESGPAPELGSEALWLPSGLIARPVAARAATGLGVADAEIVDGAVRPPYWRAPSVTEGGAFAREWRPVLAPWTRRPDRS